MPRQSGDRAAKTAPANGIAAKIKAAARGRQGPDRGARLIDLFARHLDERSCRSGCSGYSGASAKENTRHLIW